MFTNITDFSLRTSFRFNDFFSIVFLLFIALPTALMFIISFSEYLRLNICLSYCFLKSKSFILDLFYYYFWTFSAIVFPAYTALYCLCSAPYICVSITIQSKLLSCFSLLLVSGLFRNVLYNFQILAVFPEIIL